MKSLLLKMNGIIKTYKMKKVEKGNNISFNFNINNRIVILIKIISVPIVEIDTTIKQTLIFKIINNYSSKITNYLNNKIRFRIIIIIMMKR